VENTNGVFERLSNDKAPLLDDEDDEEDEADKDVEMRSQDEISAEPG
jgi:hypothetical protein